MIILIIQEILYYLVGLSYSFFFFTVIILCLNVHYYFLFGLVGIKLLIEFKQSFENQSKLTEFKHAPFNTIK